MRKNALILADESDTHALAIAKTIELEFGGSATIWNFKSFPRDPASFWLGDDISKSLKIAGIRVTEFTGIWWRRPRTFKLSPDITDDDAKQFCVKESRAFMYGALLASGVNIINHPTYETIANHKPYQLEIARSVGIKIPQTLMSNDPAEVKQFWQVLQRENKECIYKTFTPYPTFVFETRRLKLEELDHIDQIEYAPIIVQEEIKRRFDLRISIFGDEVFAAAIDPKSDLSTIDWRLDKSTGWEEYTLSSELKSQLLTFMRRMRLHYGMVDMRVTDNNEYFFFEVNPSGQFLFIEIDTKQPLCRSLASLL